MLKTQEYSPWISASDPSALYRQTHTWSAGRGREENVRINGMSWKDAKAGDGSGRWQERQRQTLLGYR